MILESRKLEIINQIKTNIEEIIFRRRIEDAIIQGLDMKMELVKLEKIVKNIKDNTY